MGWEPELGLIMITIVIDYNRLQGFASKPEKALTARKRRYCAVVELTILRETTSNRTASIFFNPKSSASGACKQKIGTFYWINDFLYFFERDIR